MHKWLLVIALISGFTSCGSGEPEEKIVAMEEPADLIPEDKMILVLADVHMLESVVAFKVPMMNRQNNPFSAAGMPIQTPAPGMLPVNDTAHKLMPYYDIFRKYGYTRDQYERSLSWYALDPEAYGLMYDEVINELTRRQAMEQQGSKPDSVKPTNN